MGGFECGGRAKMCTPISKPLYVPMCVCTCVVMWLQDCCEAALVSLACQLTPSALHMKGPGCVGGQGKERRKNAEGAGGWLCIYLHLVGICIIHWVHLIRITAWFFFPSAPLSPSHSVWLTHSLCTHTQINSVIHINWQSDMWIYHTTYIWLLYSGVFWAIPRCAPLLVQELNNNSNW